MWEVGESLLWIAFGKLKEVRDVSLPLTHATMDFSSVALSPHTVFSQAFRSHPEARPKSAFIRLVNL
jgi:hypothetical protein